MTRAQLGRGTGGATGWCLEVHDLVLSKYAAGRDKDLEFAQAVARHALADAATLRQRLADLPVSDELRAGIDARIRRDFG